MRTSIFDASALLAFMEDKPGAAKVEEILTDAQRGHSRILMSAINYGEVYGKLLRELGQEKALRSMASIGPFPIVLEDVNRQRAFRAVEVKHKYKLYYADAFAAALALEHKATLVTSDSDFKRLGHGFPVVWLRP